MPGTAVVPCRRKKVVVLIVKGSTPSLNVAPTLVLIGTFVSALALMVPLTVGGMVSGDALVVQANTKSLAIAFPARSFTPPTPPLTVTV